MALKRRTAIAFFSALGFVVAAGATLLSGNGNVLAFDDNPAAFFRADRARTSGAASRAAPAAMAVQPAGRRLTVDAPLKHRDKPRKLAAKSKPVKHEAHDRKPEKAKLAAAHAAHADNPPALAHSGGGSHSVCVRLCDGYHFPVGNAGGAGDIAAHEAACATTCPGAPTRLFVLPPGVDDISRAYSPRTGQSYTSLPVALRHAQKRDNTCSCRPTHAPQQAMVSLYRDFTLRQGDAVMTGQGFRVFRGARKLPYKPRDFAAVGSSPIGRSEKRLLQAIEKAAIPVADRWREKPQMTPITTATPVPMLGPFRVERNAQANVGASVPAALAGNIQ